MSANRKSPSIFQFISLKKNFNYRSIAVYKAPEYIQYTHFPHFPSFVLRVRNVAWYCTEHQLISWKICTEHGWVVGVSCFNDIFFLCVRIIVSNPAASPTMILRRCRIIVEHCTSRSRRRKKNYLFIRLWLRI